MWLQCLTLIIKWLISCCLVSFVVGINIENDSVNMWMPNSWNPLHLHCNKPNYRRILTISKVRQISLFFMHFSFTRLSRMWNWNCCVVLLMILVVVLLLVVVVFNIRFWFHSLHGVPRRNHANSSCSYFVVEKKKNHDLRACKLQNDRPITSHNVSLEQSKFDWQVMMMMMTMENGW